MSTSTSNRLGQHPQAESLAVSGRVLILPSAAPQALPASASHSDSESEAAEEPDSEGTQRPGPGADSEEGPGRFKLGVRIGNLNTQAGSLPQ
jgi:hypothetical protein